MKSLANLGTDHTYHSAYDNHEYVTHDYEYVYTVYEYHCTCKIYLINMVAVTCGGGTEFEGFPTGELITEQPHNTPTTC